MNFKTDLESVTRYRGLSLASLVSLLQEVTPVGRTYNHRDGMTLEEAYEEYYGSAYSPKPFLDTVSKLVDAAAEVDAGLLGADPRQVSLS